MRTEHDLQVGDGAASGLDDASVDLVVTSPPYPMIEMWDAQFSAQDSAIADALEEGRATEAFEGMHTLLDRVWDEVVRVVRPGGVVCVNVGDATRSAGGEFQCFPNHARVTTALRERGLTPLPNVLWRKPTNRLTKFMGSGTLPPNAYVTLEHEYILVFRNGPPRSFPPGDETRYESAFFWEERNRWFSDVWTFQGTDQDRTGRGRARAGSFPLALPLRLIRMFSTYGDRVYDPFVGTGTTTLAAMLSGRDSVGRDLDANLLREIDGRLDDLPACSHRRIEERLDRHRAFVAERDEPPGYDAVHYDFPVVTKQERRVRFYAVEHVDRGNRDDTGTDKGDGGGGSGGSDGGDADASSGEPEPVEEELRYLVEYDPV